jgi:hypothetical protein
MATIVAVVLAGCAPAFDPNGPCTSDGSAKGAYPELEAVIPKTFRGSGPTDLDSGRFCSTDALATLATRGVKELRFAGGTWSTGTDSGVSLAVFVDANGPPLEATWLADFYESGARSGKNVQSIQRSSGSVGRLANAERVDVLNGESFQTIVVWPQDGLVAVALVADFIREIQTREAHDAVVNEAIGAFSG